MSQYTTGEMAKLCDVTVRTVQYYDSRGILVPQELTEGGRRLYSEDDLRKLKIICFLRDLNLPIDSIRQLLSDENPEKVLDLLLEQQEKSLKDEIGELNRKLSHLEQLRKGLSRTENPTVESIADIAGIMKNQKNLKKLRARILGFGIAADILEWGSLIYAIVKKSWLPFLICLPIALVISIFVGADYFRHTSYICPECHANFRVSFKENFFARHTPTARRLTCTSCGHKGFCVETYYSPEEE